MKKVLPFLAGVLLLGISCSEQSTELTDEQRATIISEVGDQVDAIQSNNMQLNIAAFPEYWSEDEFISVISGIDFFDNRSVWIDSVANWWSRIESRSLESSEKRITPLAKNLALVTRLSIGSSVRKTGEQSNFIHQATTIWKKEAGAWKIVYLHESAQANPVDE